MKALTYFSLILLLAQTALAQVCSDKVDAGEFKKDLSELLKCGDSDLRILVSQKDKDLPLKTISVKRDELFKRLVFGAANSTSVKIDGVQVANSKVTIYSPSCKVGKTHYRHYLKPVSCKNDLSGVNAQGLLGNETAEEVIKRVDMVINPLALKAKKSCVDKISSSVEDKIRDYVKATGANVLSITSDHFNSNLMNSGHIEFHMKKVEVVKNGVKSSLELTYALYDTSGIVFGDSPTDSLGEYVRSSERTAQAKVSINTEKFQWRDSETNVVSEGSQAVLKNKNTGVTISKLDLPNVPCKDEVRYNQDDISSAGHDDTTVRENSKADLAAPVVNQKVTPTAKQE